jgi:hypothetical protein
VVLFFVLWFAYGLTINSTNILDFSAATIEAIVDRHQFVVDNATVWPAGDTFSLNGHVYSNKQPGQAMICAAVYAQLRMIGISYDEHPIFAQALVIFFTASFLTALAGVVVFRLARELDDRRSMIWPVLAALTFGLGTTIFAYAGIAHHDIIATAFLIIAFYAVFMLRQGDADGRNSKIKSTIAGLLLGLTLTTSMLHFFMVVLMGIYFLTFRKWKLIPYFLISGFIGLVPLFIYDWINFGSPFLMAAIANYQFTGYDPEVFFAYERAKFLHRVDVYSRYITQYDPVLWIAFPGLFFVQKKYFREVFFILASILVLVAYVTNIEGLGTCAYGPRYLIPLMPYAALGVIGLRRIPWRPAVYVAGVLVVLVGAKSAFINLIGAMRGAMYCNMAGYAYPDYYIHVMNGNTGSFRLFWWLLPLAVLFLGALVVGLFLKRPQNTLEAAVSPDGLEVRPLNAPESS